jgi:hypothetical protein
MRLDPDKRFDASLAKVDFLTDQKDSFRNELDPDSVALLDRSLGEHLHAWGYR